MEYTVDVMSRYHRRVTVKPYYSVPFDSTDRPLRSSRMRTCTRMLAAGLLGSMVALHHLPVLAGTDVLVKSGTDELKQHPSSNSSPGAIQPLAILQMGPGHDITFSVDAADGTIVVDEQAGLDRPSAMPVLMREQFDDLDALGVYIALTPRNRAVPSALLASGSQEKSLQAAMRRPSTESLVAMPALLMEPRVKVEHTTGSMNSLCGSNGKQQFENICSTSFGAFASKNSHCASGKHPWHGRFSSGKVKQSHSLVVSCSAAVQSRHGRKIGGVWYYKTTNLDVPGVWHHMRVYNKSIKLSRYAKATMYNPTNPNINVSFIRSWIGFK